MGNKDDCKHEWLKTESKIKRSAIWYCLVGDYYSVGYICGNCGKELGYVDKSKAEEKNDTE